MQKGLEILSNIVIWSKYAKYISEIGRRETWEEIIDRYEIMMVKKYPALKEEIFENTKYIRQKKVLPSMRMIQFAGTALEVNHARGYNCSYAPVDSIYTFSEGMFLLLSGVGLGYSVQKHHVEKLPQIVRPTKSRKFVVADDIMGWADAVKALIKAYFIEGTSLPEFDFRQIRLKGARLITAGGKAPGHEPLMECLHQIKRILDRKESGSKLSPIECHSILCHIANSVLAGGIRRSACIALFSKDDEEMLTCKYGNWWEQNEHFGRANNSVVLERGKISKEEFDDLWKRIQLSGSGEPGIYWTNNLNMGTNPCCEISLRAFQTCNLCELNVSSISSQAELNKLSAVAAFFGTLQAGFTDFHYLRPIWKRTCEKDALLGIGMTGIGSGEILNYDLTMSVNIAIVENERISKLIGINKSARVSCVKPSGTTSCVLGTSSGIHAWHDKYYLRTIRFNRNEAIADYMLQNHPELCELDNLRPHDTLCVRIPIEAPEGALLRSEPALETLKRVRKVATEWVLPGHIAGDNTHNVSATINLKDEEWDSVGEWMWNNRDDYNGLSVMPYDGGTYSQHPFESITKEEYEERYQLLLDVNTSRIIEAEDNVQFTSESACSGNQCEVR